MTQNKIMSFPMVPFEISNYRHIISMQNHAIIDDKKEKDDYMRELEKSFDYDKKPYDDDFDFLNFKNIGFNIDKDYELYLELLNKHKNKLFTMNDSSFMPTFIMHDVWAGQISVFKYPNWVIKFESDIDKSKYPIHAECLEIMRNETISDYAKLIWLFEKSDHVAYAIPDVTTYNPELWEDINKSVMELKDFPNTKIRDVANQFLDFIDELEYKPNPKRLYMIYHNLENYRYYTIKRIRA